MDYSVVGMYLFAFVFCFFVAMGAVGGTIPGDISRFPKTLSFAIKFSKLGVISCRIFAFVSGIIFGIFGILTLSFMAENAGLMLLSDLLIRLSFFPLALFGGFLYWILHKIVPDVRIMGE